MWNRLGVIDVDVDADMCVWYCLNICGNVLNVWKCTSCLNVPNKTHKKKKKKKFRSKCTIFLSCGTLKFGRWLWKTIEHPFYTTSSFVHQLKAICEFKLELRFGNAQIGAKFVSTSMTLTFCTDNTFVNGNHSWKFHDNTMTGTLWKRCHTQTDRQTNRQTDGQTRRANATVCMST